jgi:hypothetical protein
MTPRETLAIVFAFLTASAMFWVAVTPAAIEWLLALPGPVLTGFATLLIAVSAFTASRRKARR